MQNESKKFKNKIALKEEIHNSFCLVFEPTSFLAILLINYGQPIPHFLQQKSRW